MRSMLSVAVQLFYKCGILQLLLWCEREFGWKQHILVLLYHHIAPVGGVNRSLSAVEDGMPVDEFDRQLKVLRKWYAPCHFDDLLSAAERPASVECDSLMVTFDDGYLDNRTLAMPCLESYGVPAIVFVASGFIDSQKQFWWIRLNDIMRRLTDETLEEAVASFEDMPDLRQILCSSTVAIWSARRETRMRIAGYLESLPDDQKRTILDRLQAIAGMAETSCLPLLSWSDLCQMQDEGFVIGGHTESHPSLETLSREEVARELSTSTEELVRRTGHRPRAFAYPYGAYNSDVISEVRQAGYSVALTVRPGCYSPANSEPYEVPRLQIYTSEEAKLTALILLFKLSKYLPRLSGLALSRAFGGPFQT